MADYEWFKPFSTAQFGWETSADSGEKGKHRRWPLTKIRKLLLKPECLLS